MNMLILDDFIKMDIKGTNFIFVLNSSLQHGVKADFSKS